VGEVEHLPEFLKHSPNLSFLAKLRKTHLQPFLITAPNLLGLRKKAPLRVKIRALTVARRNTFPVVPLRAVVMAVAGCLYGHRRGRVVLAAVPAEPCRRARAPDARASPRARQSGRRSHRPGD
jgi:hypothetical protein